MNQQSEKPWLDKDGNIKNDMVLRQVSPSWDADTWERFLKETVEQEKPDDEACFEEAKNLEEEHSEDIWLSHSRLNPALQKSFFTAIKHLPKRQRQVIRLLYWCENTEREVAKKLKITRGSVRIFHARSISNLKHLMQKVSPKKGLYIGGYENEKPKTQREQILEVYQQDLKGKYL